MGTQKDYKSILAASTKSAEYEFLEEPTKGIVPVLCKHLTCGHIWKVAPYELLVRGSGCPICVKKTRREKIVKNTEWYQEELRAYDKNYEVLGTYQDISTNLEHKCLVCDSTFSARPGNVLYSVRNKKKHYCPTCMKRNLSKEKSLGVGNFIHKLNKLFKNEIPYTFDAEEFTTLDTKMHFTCNKCGYTFSMSPTNILRPKAGHLCARCNNMERDHREYKVRCLESSGGKIEPLGTYVNRETPVLHKCLVCNHTWESKPAARLAGQGCPKCAKKITRSTQELELTSYIQSLYSGEVILNSRKLLGTGQELDIYLPDLKVAIEMHGLYFHNAEKKGAKYHQEKFLAAKENGIRLIQIFQDEWLYKQELVSKKLKYILGLSTDLPKIYARQCTVKLISVSEKNNFLNTFHLQGADRSCLNLGLYTKSEELIAVFTLARPRLALGRTSASENEFEISRYCADTAYLVLGGFGKMLGYLLKNYEISSLYTYADLRWSVGSLYLQNGFSCEGYTHPSYSYFHNTKDNCKRYHRFQFRKSKLAELLPNFYDPSLTEIEIMTAAGYKRIFDAGCLKFTLDNKH
jgi:hypothetical protein